MPSIYAGAIYNILACLLTAVVSLVVWWSLRKRRRKEGSLKFPESIDCFLLLFGIMWFFVALRTFFFWAGRPALDLFIFTYFAGTLTYLHMMPLFYYFGWSFFHNSKTRNWFNVFFAIIILAATFVLVSKGAVPGEATYWGTDPSANAFAKKIFTIGVLFPLSLIIAIELARRIMNWKKTKSPTAKWMLGFASTFLIYFVIGVFDALGSAEGWRLLISRAGESVVPLLIFFFATADED